jgi:hypothetical protein
VDRRNHGGHPKIAASLRAARLVEASARRKNHKLGAASMLIKNVDSNRVENAQWVPHPNLAFFARLGWGFSKDKPRLQHQRSIALKGPGFTPAARAANSNPASAAEVVHSWTLSFSNLTEAPTEGKKRVLSRLCFISLFLAPACEKKSRPRCRSPRPAQPG